MHKALIIVTAVTMAGSAYAQSPADGLTKDPKGIAAVEFLDLAINKNKVDEAAAKYLAPPACKSFAGDSANLLAILPAQRQAHPPPT